MSHYAKIRKKTLYVYGMRLRGFSPGCQPMEGLVERRDPSKIGQSDRRYHDLLIYDRLLTDQELRNYELDFLGTEAR